MADKLTLQLETRTMMGKKTNRLRREGIVPATVYGKGVGPFSVQVDARTFNSLLRRAGKTTLIELSIPGQPTSSAFIHALQRHPVSREIIHVDLRVVDLTIDITVDVPVHFVGSSDLVNRGDAVLNHGLTTLSIRALPADIPSAIEVDISGLDDLDKTIYVRDVVLATKGTIMNPEDEVVASVTPPAREEDPTTTDEPASVEPELVRDDREGDGE